MPNIQTRPQFPPRVEAAFRLLWHVETAVSLAALRSLGLRWGLDSLPPQNKPRSDQQVAATRSAYELIRNYINGELEPTDQMGDSQFPWQAS